MNDGCTVEGRDGFFCTQGCQEQWEAKQKEKASMTLEAEARSLIGGDRRESYGPAKQSFANIADTWSAHLSQRGIIKEGTYLEGRDVAIMMAAFKLLRESAKPKRDNLVDAIGYVLLAEQAT